MAALISRELEYFKQQSRKLGLFNLTHDNHRNKRKLLRNHISPFTTID